VEQYLIANSVEDAIFFSMIGLEANKLLRSLVAPTSLGEKSYNDLVKLMTDYHCLSPLKIVQRYRFHTRFRQQGETVETYMLELCAIHSSMVQFW